MLFASRFRINKPMKTNIIIGITLIAWSSLGQTNSPITTQVQTNLQVATPEMVLSNQMQAVRRAMPQYFEFSRDEVDQTIAISLNEYMVLEDDNGATLRADVDAFVHPPKEYADKISLHFVSQTSEWRFLDNHNFIIRYDDKTLSPDADYSNKIFFGGVAESFFPDFTLEQFHDIAWADKVFVKLGYLNYEIPYEDRQKWKLLWKYFDLKKKQADADLSKAVQ